MTVTIHSFFVFGRFRFPFSEIYSKTLYRIWLIATENDLSHTQSPKIHFQNWSFTTRTLFVEWIVGIRRISLTCSWRERIIQLFLLPQFVHLPHTNYIYPVYDFVVVRYPFTKKFLLYKLRIMFMTSSFICKRRIVTTLKIRMIVMKTE